ncbi:MAG: putative Glyceraldehyde-3-phosphate dehydrogenase [Firmicutes bacterium]|nr:putative Glyceraldehyde-3-phosphate dehydrogenase [Bacillota bacterium]
MSVLDAGRLCPALEDIPVAFHPAAFKQEARYLIDGKIKDAAPKKILSPIQSKTAGGIQPYELGVTPWLDPAIAMETMQSAEKAYNSGLGEWPQMPVEERIKCIEKLIQRMIPLEEEFILRAMWEIAKSYQACRDEFRRTIKYAEDTVTRLREDDLSSCSVQQLNEFEAQIRRCPLGPTLLMGPFNYPLNETFAMLVPALVMGNSVVMKMPAWGAWAMDLFLDALCESFPPGVINVINGDGASIISPIMQRGSINILGFIGSTAVAHKIIGQHPYVNRLRTILGLEAKNPAFVFPDCDLELTVRECLQGALEYNGQRCTALKHIWVHKDILDRFLTALSDAISQVKYGMPWESDVMITPLAEKNKCAVLSNWIEQAQANGAGIINPGGGEHAGNLFYPSILYPVTREMELFHVEQFGPVIPVSSFSSMDEIAAYMAECPYGQQASIFTRSPALAAPLIDILVTQVSRINLNAQCRRGPDDLPFTGRKDSAEGTLSVEDALRSFSIRALVVANQSGRELFDEILDKGNSKFLRR